MKQFINRDLILPLLIVGFLGIDGFKPAKGQVAEVSEKNAYIDQESRLGVFENVVMELIQTENHLSPAEALAQLESTLEKKVTIEKVNPYTQPLSSTDLAKRVKESTVVFGTAYDCGRCNLTHINAASGYIIDESGIIATNYHVVEAFGRSENNKNLAMAIQTSDERVYLVKEVLASDREGDLCVVRVDTKDDRLVPLPLGDVAQQGDQIFVMSHPNNMMYYFTSGMVARNYLSPKDEYQHRAVPIMDITADYAAGSSGAPIVDAKGNLVSTVSSTRSIYYEPREQRNLQMVVKQTYPVILLKNMVQWR